MGDSTEKNEKEEEGDNSPALALEVSPDLSVKASVGSRFIGRLIDLFGGRKEARNIVERQVAISIAEKGGEQLTEFEEFIKEEVLYRKQYERRRKRGVAMLLRADEVFPDMERKVKLLPAPETQPHGGKISEGWFSRVLRDAEDVSDEEVRDLYARILAGEIARPGTFSLRTLSVLRDLDRDTARIFETVLKSLWKEDALPVYGKWPAYQETGITYTHILALREAGLLASADNLFIAITKTADVHDRWYVPYSNEAAFAVRVAVEPLLPPGRSAPPVPQSLSIPVYRLSAAGKELSLLPARQADDGHMQGIAQYIVTALADNLNNPLVKTEIYIRKCHLDQSGAVMEEVEFAPPVSWRTPSTFILA